MTTVNTRWVLLAEVTDPQALSAFYWRHGAEEASDKTLEEGRVTRVVETFDRQDEAELMKRERPETPGLVYHVEEREVSA